MKPIKLLPVTQDGCSPFKRSQVTDSEKLNDLMELLHKNRSILGQVYVDALHIISK